MAGDEQRRRVRVDADGVRIETQSGVRGGVWIALAAVALVGVLLLVVRRSPTDRVAPPAGPPPAVAAGDPPAARQPAAPPIEPRRRAAALPAAPAAPPPPAPAAGAEPPAKEDAVFGKVDPNQPSGIALFPPPGTKPIKQGVLVPEDFELPPGYVRHYQATDDGERVPAILMYHPDYHPVDAEGRAIPLPADRIVPPDQVPAGMPVQMLELPEDQSAADATP